MRNSLRKIPLETGNRWAIYALVAWIALTIGWVSHQVAAPIYCWYPG